MRMTICQTEGQWLDFRKSTIGSTRAAPVCGLSPYSTAAGVYLEMKGRISPQPPNEAMRWGLRHEASVADAYAEKTGFTFKPKITPWEMYHHYNRPWMTATPDRIVVDECGRLRVVELKTASAFSEAEWGAPGTDHVPEHYLVQVQHQMDVLDMDSADVAVLIGGNDFRIYHVPRNERIIDHLHDVEEEFWHMVNNDIQPSFDFGHASTRALLDRLYVPSGGTVDLGEKGLALAKEWSRLTLALDVTAMQKEAVKNELIAMMGDASDAIVGNAKFTRRITKRQGYTVQPSTYTTFRLQNGKDDKE